MSAIPHHTSDAVCPLCEQKLSQAHMALAEWFREMKVRYPDIHVSWSYRDQASQEQAFEEGKSKLHFPNSPHNKTPSLALDLFQIDDQGKPKWDRDFFENKLYSDIQSESRPMIWGGTFTSLGDFDHFQLKESA